MIPASVHNLFCPSPASLDQEQIETLLQTDSFRIERIVSNGQSSPEGFWFDQPEDEWVVLLKGSATLSFVDEKRMDLKAGDYFLIPAHLKHQVERTSEDALWLAVHFNRRPE